MKYSLLCLLFVFLELSLTPDSQVVKFDWNNFYHGRGSQRLSLKTSRKRKEEKTFLLGSKGRESSCCARITKPFLVLWGCISKRKSKVKT